MADFNLNLLNKSTSPQEIRRIFQRLASQGFDKMGTMAFQDADSVAITGGTITGTVITVDDDEFTIQDDGDNTKKAVFEASGISTGTTRTYTFPDASGTLALSSSLLWQRTGTTLSPVNANDNILIEGGAIINDVIEEDFFVYRHAPTKDIAFGYDSTSDLFTVKGASGRVTGGSSFVDVYNNGWEFAGNGAGHYYIFNTYYGDADFYIRKQGSGTAYNYDAGNDLHTFGSPVTITDTTDSTSKDTGSVILEGGMGVEKAVFIGTKLMVDADNPKTWTVANGIIEAGVNGTLSSFSAGGGSDIYLSNNFYYDGASRSITATPASNLILTNGGGLQFFNDTSVSSTDEVLGITKRFEVTATGGGYFSGDLDIDGTTDSTSTSIGSIVTDGGAGIAKNVYVGDNITVVGGASSNLIIGDEAYSALSSYTGLKTSFMSGTTDYMILSGSADGNTYVSSKAGSFVQIRSGGNLGTHLLQVADTGASFAGALLVNSSGNDYDFIVNGNGVEAGRYDSGNVRWQFEQLIKSSSGRIKNVNRLTSNTTLDNTYHKVYCDTDNGSIEITFPAGVDGTEYIIYNVGSSGNDVTVTPNGSETVSLDTLYDGEDFEYTYDSTEGWR